MLAVAGLFFASCSSDDDSSAPVGDNTTLAGNLTESLTLDPSVEYKLTGALIVRENVTLTIPAGTTIKATAGGTGVYVLVERGGTIIADGEPNAPITFTSDAANPTPGDWGGIIINGYAPISRQTGAVSEAPTEVNTAIIFGGDQVGDSSGILDHVIIKYSGARIDDESEHNGLTLNGVGNGTTLSNIMIAYGDDDAIEFFGGSVNASNILVVNCTDDMFDFSQGYTGTLNNAYGIREAGYLAVTSDPRGIEADGNLDGNSPTDINQSNFTVNDITIINNAVDTDPTMVDVFKIRRGATATITNAYAQFADGVIVSDLVDFTDSRGDATDATSINFTVGSNLSGATVKNTTSGGATITETTTNTGADTSVWSWTGYSFQ